MGWQEYAVLAIGVLVAGIVIRRLWCLFRGGKEQGCASCGSTGCPLRRRKKK